jgi:hypothetical protein
LNPLGSPECQPAGGQFHLNNSRSFDAGTV